MQITLMRRYILLLSCFMAVSLNAQDKADGNPALLFFDSDTVTKAEFERVYQKNNGGYDEAKKHETDQYKEYLDLYINFKRKVFEAEELGLQDTDAFKQEFQTYRKQLAEPYLSSKEVEEKLIKEAYDRSFSVVKASHLLVSVAEDASPEDTLAAYQKIIDYRQMIISGDESFVDLAEKNSDDPSAKQNKGNLGYFTVFDMVYPFESAAYETKPGEVSTPIRTQFGYHLIYVDEKVKIQGKKEVGHIIVRVGDRYSAKDSAQADKIIQEIYEKLKNGEDFASLAGEFSDDPNSAKNGGSLGTGRLLPEMEILKYNLDVGEFSEPFNTAYGWHVLKVLSVDSIPKFEKAQMQLKQRISRDSRSKLGRESVIARIKNDNKYKTFDDNTQAFIQTLTNAFPSGTWKPDSTQTDLYQKPLFTLNDKDIFLIQDFIDFYVSSRLRRPRMSIKKAAEDMISVYTERELMKYEENLLPQKNPEFKNLVQEYRDGILLFTLMEQKVWKKAVEDTTGLKAYYDAHPDSFQSDILIDVKEYRSESDSIMAVVATLLEEGTSDGEIDSLINESSALTVRIFSQTYEKGDTDLNESIFEEEEGFISDVLPDGEFYRILHIQKKYPAGLKPFNKARSEVITSYQNYLEREWLKELAEKYPVQVNDQGFNTLFQ